MYAHPLVIEIAVLLVLVAVPVLLGIGGVFSSRSPSGAAGRTGEWNWKLTILSALLYTLAYNVIFFIQELFLVLPKALTPGLRPILFHNNHTWTGDNPLAALFQGTGALAILLVASVCALKLRFRPPRSVGARLFLTWMIYNGFMQSLPQVVIGSFEPANDVGMAMDYLHLSAAAKTLAALAALLAIAVVALSLRRPLLSLADSAGEIASGRTRTRFMFKVATLPAIAAILLVIPFRIPRNWIEVIAAPAVVTLIGIVWIQAGAWAVRDAKADGKPLSSRSLEVAFGALLGVFLIFQFILRPGIRFY
jgi:hypothetical protein